MTLPDPSEAVRRRIRRMWERRRHESAGMSEAFIPAHPKFCTAERVLNHRELHVIPEREAHWRHGGFVPHRPERPRPPEGVAVRLVRAREERA